MLAARPRGRAALIVTVPVLRGCPPGAPRTGQRPSEELLSIVENKLWVVTLAFRGLIPCDVQQSDLDF